MVYCVFAFCKSLFSIVLLFCYFCDFVQFVSLCCYSLLYLLFIFVTHHSASFVSPVTFVN